MFRYNGDLESEPVVHKPPRTVPYCCLVLEVISFPSLVPPFKSVTLVSVPLIGIPSP